jgi:hypothetical protein
MNSLMSLIMTVLMALGLFIPLMAENNIKLRITGSDVALRQQPGTGAQVVNRLPLGALVTIREQGKKDTIGGKTGRWNRVSYDGITGQATFEGWIFDAYAGTPDKFRRVTSFRKTMISGEYGGYSFTFLISADGTLLFRSSTTDNDLGGLGGGKCPAGMVRKGENCYVTGWLTRAGSLVRVEIDPRWKGRLDLSIPAEHGYFILDARGKLKTIEESEYPVYGEK